MWRHIKPISQVIIYATAMLVSSSHETVFENTTKWPVTFYLVHTTIPNYNTAPCKEETNMAVASMMICKIGVIWRHMKTLFWEDRRVTNLTHVHMNEIGISTMILESPVVEIESSVMCQKTHEVCRMRNCAIFFVINHIDINHYHFRHTYKNDSLVLISSKNVGSFSKY